MTYAMPITGVISMNRVLHVVDHLIPASGVASVVMHLVNGVPEFTQDIAVYGECDKIIEQTVINCGGEVHPLPDVTLQLGKPFSKAYSELLQRVPYTIIHGHLMNSAFIYLREAKRVKIPGRIIHAHSALGADTFVKRVRNKVLSMGVDRWANSMVAVSNEATHHAYGKKSGRVNICENGIDVNRFKFDEVVRQQVRSELGIANDVLCVGHVGRFAGLKNHTFLLDVFRAMSVHTHCLLLLVGEGYLEDEIKGMVQVAGLEECVKFMGVKRDVERMYQAFDVFLLPSHSEGFGLAAVEAQCAGLGCVVSEYVPRVVECSKRIRFLPLGDSELWAETALELAKQDRGDGSEMVRCAGLDTESMCNKFLHIYKQLTGGT